MNVWDLKAGFYNVARAFPVFKNIHDAEMRNLQRLIPAQTFACHLDLGTGTGSSLKVFPLSKFTVVSDASRNMLAIAKKNPPYPAVQCNAGENLPFRSNIFDLVTAIGLLEYLQNMDIFFKEIFRVAKGGATLVFTSTPPGMCSKLRILTGTRPHTRSGQSIRFSLRAAGWIVRGHAHSLMQEQWLCRKSC
jgi:ubiquinone/menaquinone biosynthesis C-methylase UbiE